MQRIIFSVICDIKTDQRIDKIANTLLKNGYEILVISRKLHKEKITRNYNLKLLKMCFKRSIFMYLEFNLRLFFILLFYRCNILLSNDLDTLLPNYMAAKIRRKKLVYDSHEYFTELPEVISRKHVKYLWTRLENFLLPKIKNSYTVCQSIADIYNQKYGINMQVIRNVPILRDNISDKLATEEQNIIIYQGALNMGRGIEYMILAMKYLKTYKLWIIGDGTTREELEKLSTENNLNNQITFFGKIPLEELSNITCKATLGLSLEENMGLNYYYALPNKLFDYINSNIPVLVSNLPEMRRIVETYQVGTFILSHEPKHIAEKIESILTNKNTYQLYKQNTYLARTELNWQNEEIKLLDIFRNIY